MQFQDFVIPTYQHNHLVKVIYTFTHLHSKGQREVIIWERWQFYLHFFNRNEKKNILTRNSM